jgi:hypothetical protein
VGKRGHSMSRELYVIFFCGKGKENNRMGVGFFVHHRIVPAGKRVEFVSDRILYIVLRGRLCNIIVLNVHAPSEEKSDDPKDSFYEELEQTFHHYSKYHIKIILGDFNSNVGRRIFSNRQLGRTLYIRTAMIIV